MTVLARTAFLAVLLTTPLAAAGPLCTAQASGRTAEAMTVAAEEKWCCCKACCGWAVSCNAIPGCSSC